jgi:hypothetical protein
VHQVLIHRPRSLRSAGDGDALLLGIGEQVVAALELLDELRDSPGGKNLDTRSKSLPRKLKADLIVTLKEV